VSGGIAVDGIGAAELAVRFFHLDKLPIADRLTLDPGAFEPIGAAIAGLPIADFREVRQGLIDLRLRTAEGLLAEPGVIASLDRLPFRKGDVVVAIGDSITDDLLSWAHLLDSVITAGRPDLDVHVVNAGYTGDTTQEAISRFDTVARHRPAWILQMLGTNDARHHGAARVCTTTPEESARNFAVLRELIATETSARLVTLTPPPVVGEAASAWEPFREEKIGWRERDVELITAHLLASASDVIDVNSVLAASPWQHWLLPDGVHPNSAGQATIARTVLAALADLPAQA
jgi:lysophospholipase L1-like esterase